MTATSHNSRVTESTEYKGFTIEPDYFLNPYTKGHDYVFYKTEEGIQHDADGDSEVFKYTGNCKWADSIEEAMTLIDELVPFFVETYGTVPLGKRPQVHITKFDWLSEAVKFAIKFNGKLSVNFNCP